MKITKISGFGNYGQIIENADFDHMSDEEWFEIGRSHLKKLITIFKNPKITKDQWYERITQLGPLKANLRAHFKKKYGKDINALDASTWAGIDDEDRYYIESKKYMLEKTEGGKYLTRVYGAKDKDGNLQGVFSSGDVHWHSNESGILTFTPEVSLLGGEYMEGSATGFVQTVDYYESLSESFRSELDEMIIVHRYKLGSMNEEEYQNPKFRTHVKLGFCPEDGSEVPLVITSPGGIRGLHYSVNTVYQIKGMSLEDSEKIFKILEEGIFKKEYVYDHYYQNNNDFLMFDNSVTLHRRLGGSEKRKAYRLQYDPGNLLKEAWLPYHQKEFIDAYIDRSIELQNLLQLKDFKLPKKLI
jgi:alpha-ketoglutarate-dependent taurine dioxygenase